MQRMKIQKEGEREVRHAERFDSQSKAGIPTTIKARSTPTSLLNDVIESYCVAV